MWLSLYVEWPFCVKWYLLACHERVVAHKRDLSKEVFTVLMWWPHPCPWAFTKTRDECRIQNQNLLYSFLYVKDFCLNRAYPCHNVQYMHIHVCRLQGQFIVQRREGGIKCILTSFTAMLNKVLIMKCKHLLFSGFCDKQTARFVRLIR